MRYSLLAAMLLSLVSVNTLASEKPDASAEGTLSQDHTNEETQASDTSKEGIDIGGGWIFSGDIRTGWVQYTYENPPGAGNDTSINKGHTDSKGFYVMPKLSITSPTWGGVSGKITGAGATDFGLNDPAYESRTFVYDGTDPGTFAILQELYVKYEKAGNKALVGREELTTPMIDADDWYMLANSFCVAHYTNTMIEDNMFMLTYFHKMSGVWDSGAGSDPVIAPKGGTDFYSMSQASFVSQVDKDNANDAGVAMAAYQYNNDTHNVQVWNYFATDLYNTLFAQYDFTSEIGGLSYDLGAQFIDFQEVGKLADNAKVDRAGGNAGRTIDASLYSVRFDGSFTNGVNFATGAAKYSDGDGFGSVLGAWGGYPYFANGMIFHFFEADTLQNAASYKAQLGYDILDGLWVGGRYTFWDLDPTKSISSSTGQGQDYMAMYGVRLSYSGVAGTYFTGTYEFVDLDQQPDISSLRLIGGIKF